MAMPRTFERVRNKAGVKVTVRPSKVRKLGESRGLVRGNVKTRRGLEID